LLPVLMCIR